MRRTCLKPAGAFKMHQLVSNLYAVFALRTSVPSASVTISHVSVAVTFPGPLPPLHARSVVGTRLSKVSCGTRPCREASVSERYIASVYWTIATMMSVGYGDISAGNPSEWWMARGTPRVPSAHAPRLGDGAASPQGSELGCSEDRRMVYGNGSGGWTRSSEHAVQPAARPDDHH